MDDTTDASAVPPRRRRPARQPLRAYAAMRTVHALERLAFRPMSAPELAHAVQIDPRTARRLLMRLAAEDYLTQPRGHRRRYHPTLRLAALGRQALQHTPWPRQAAPWVATLAAQTRWPCALWIPCYDIACRLHAEPDDPPPQPVLGALQPACPTAAGRVRLAHRTGWVDSLLDARPRPDGGPQRELRADLERIHARGHATGPATIAAPVALDGQV
jgi:DNA-binding IclR family transcriptional regulator